MCITWTGPWEEAKEKIKGWKIVRKKGGKFRSMVRPEGRMAQRELGEWGWDGPRNKGTDLTYIPGETVESKEPGIYIHTSWAEARFDFSARIYPENVTILGVTVPKGTKIRRGPCGKMTALRVEVGEEVVCADGGIFLPPNPQLSQSRGLLGGEGRGGGRESRGERVGSDSHDWERIPR